MINYCVGVSFRHLDLVEQADRCNQKGRARVAEFYGSVDDSLLPSIGFGSGAEHAAWDELAAFTRAAGRYGMRVHLNLNTLRLTPDFVAKNADRITGFLRRAEETGVEAVILAAVPLIEFAIRQKTSLRISVSAIAEVDTLQKIRRYREMGVHRVILSLFKGRDFAFLERLRGIEGLEWEILCNEICRMDCPFLPQHYLHRSNEDFSSDPTRDYYYRFCYGELMENFPLNILRTRFIRPEDVPLYHDRLGINFFKIVRRESHPELIRHYMTAYTGLEYGGDLMDLFPMFTRTPRQLHSPRAAALPNRRLDGFLEHYWNERPDCGDDCFDTGGACDHCRRWAARLASPAAAVGA